MRWKWKKQMKEKKEMIEDWLKVCNNLSRKKKRVEDDKLYI